jgi:hypothetical protein
MFLVRSVFRERLYSGLYMGRWLPLILFTSARSPDTTTHSPDMAVSSFFIRISIQPKPIMVIAGVPNSLNSAIVADIESIIDLLIKVVIL